FATLEEAVLSELSDEADPTPIARKSVEASYRWNPVSEQYELNLDLEKVMALLRLRRQMKTYQIPLADLPVLFIGPRYQEEPEWRKEALKQLDPQIKQVLLEGLGHELYTEAPEIVAREVNN
ncbi:MAG: alpha/beta hydrolase, partial [Streptococcus parasanguinis]|nr:alpha/beta hydrolase [Streptococcus parasanguinis]